MAGTAIDLDWTWQLYLLRELFPQWEARHFRIYGQHHSDLGC